jgi:hypothetical protein
MRLMPASIGDFQRDSLARVMRRRGFDCAGWFVQAGFCTGLIMWGVSGMLGCIQSRHFNQ